jgi:hypothetical protein
MLLAHDLADTPDEQPAKAAVLRHLRRFADGSYSHGAVVQLLERELELSQRDIHMAVPCG